GIPTPAFSAASMIRVPFGTSTCTPLIVQVTVSFASLAPTSVLPVAIRAISATVRHGPAHSDRRQARILARFGADQSQVVVPELLDRTRDRRRGGIAQHADRGAGHVRADLQQRVEVLFRAPSRLDPPEDLRQPFRALAARRALPARLVGVELDHPSYRRDDVDRVVDHDDGRRPEHAPRAGDALVIHRDVDLVRAQDRDRAAARDHRLELAPVANPSADVVDQLLQVETERELEVAAADDVAGDVEELGAGALLGPERTVPLGAVPDDVRDRADRLDVVDRGRHPEGADRGRERRLDPGLAPPALERVHEPCLLAADVGARAEMERHVDPDAGTEDVLSDQPGRVRFLDGPAEDLRRFEELATDVDVDVLRPDRVGGNQRALDELVRRPPDQLTVLEGARLGFVRVDQEVVRLAVVLRHEAPLHAGREARAAAAAQPALLDDIDDRVPVHLERLPERGVPAPLLPARE